jgi:hypothetical protein
LGTLQNIMLIPSAHGRGGRAPARSIPMQQAV